jgi:hypothetical protein
VVVKRSEENGEESDRQKADKALSEFLQSGWDTERRISDLAKFQVVVTGTSMYLPANTKALMDQNYGRPVLAVMTKTASEQGKIYFRPIELDSPGSRRVRPTRTLGAAYVGIAIPLRKLGIEVPPSHRLILDVESIQDPKLGMVYSIQFLGFEVEKRNLDPDVEKAKKAVVAEEKKARKAERLQGLEEKRASRSKGTNRSENAG